MSPVKKSASRFLEAIGVDARRYWLLLGVFKALNSRREISWGKAGLDFNTTMATYSAFTALISLVMVLGRLNLKHPVNEPAAPYLTVFMIITGFVMLSLLLSEVAAVLVNPAEGVALAHFPINGATYSAVKLTHLIRLLGYGVLALNTIPAFAILIAGEVRWFYPLNHMLATFAVGLLIAVSCCSAFGLLVRFVPASRLKGIGHAAQFIPVAVLGMRSVVRRSGVQLPIPDWLPIFWPAQLFLFGHHVNRQPVSFAASIFIVALIGIIAFGMRSLRADYLVRVHSIVYGGASARVRTRRSRLGESITRFCGGQLSRAGFEYVRRMMLRDWEFKRRVIVIVPMMASLLSLLFRGTGSPFSEKLSLIHLMPHIFGVALFWICSFLAYGGQGKTGWIFQALPEQALHPFVRGVYASLWLPLIVVPHMIVFAPLGRLWGAGDAALFIVFSIALSSLYLSAELSLIDGIPFFNKPDPARTRNLVPIILTGTLAGAIAVVVQHYLIFRSHLSVAVAIVITGFAARAAGRRSLDAFQIAIRDNIRTLRFM